MAQALNRFTAREVETIATVGMHHDGGGLFLKVGPTGNKSWCYRYKIAGRQLTVGLGPYNKDANGLALARKKAAQLRAARAAGEDPQARVRAARDRAERERSEAARQVKEAAERERAEGMTFESCALQYVGDMSPAWRNPKHRQQWSNTLRTYAYPKIGALPVGAVSVDHVVSILKPIWREKSETASRLRGRIEVILDWAKVKGYRSGENPARLRGNLDFLLPKQTKKAIRVEHHAALPFADLPAFYADLRSREGVAARALELAILTACRTSEVLGARWSEFDLEAGVWELPSERMKASRAHRVPLAPAAIQIIKGLRRSRSPFLFPGEAAGKPLSNMAMLAVLKRMNRKVTTHGFRSTFSDWAAETTPYPREVVEMALAHAIANQVEAAYRRGDLFEKRRALMNDWAAFVTSATTPRAES